MVIEKGDGLKVNYNCNNNLNSLTDILKKNMFFIDALGVEEITLHIAKEVLGKRMDLDENFNELKDEIKLYLETNECFVSDFGLWTVKFKKVK